MPTSLHRYYGAGYSHFITTSCYQRRPLLGTPRSRDLFLEVMEQIRQRHQFVVVGYVVMPEHIHLLGFGAKFAQQPGYRVRWSSRASLWRSWMPHPWQFRGWAAMPMGSGDFADVKLGFPGLID